MDQIANTVETLSAKNLHRTSRESLPSPQTAVLPLIEDLFSGDGRGSQADPIRNAFLHHFKTPGGGTRVVLTKCCADALGISGSDADILAAAVECLHNASLVQDDLQDGSLYRRGQASVFAEFGRDVALGLTNRLITAAFSSLTQVSRPETLGKMVRRLDGAVAETVGGQTSELVGNAESRSFGFRIAASRRKSGPLFALALELPLIFANEEGHLERAHDAACSFGLGYQILDDLADQALDSSSRSTGNLVLAMKENGPEGWAEQAAARLARLHLDDALAGAEKLPRGSGRPLADLIERLLPQLDAFAP